MNAILRLDLTRTVYFLEPAGAPAGPGGELEKMDAFLQARDRAGDGVVPCLVLAARGGAPPVRARRWLSDAEAAAAELEAFELGAAGRLAQASARYGREAPFAKQA